MSTPPAVKSRPDFDFDGWEPDPPSQREIEQDLDVDVCIAHLALAVKAGECEFFARIHFALETFNEVRRRFVGELSARQRDAIFEATVRAKVAVEMQLGRTVQARRLSRAFQAVEAFATAFAHPCKERQELHSGAEWDALAAAVVVGECEAKAALIEAERFDDLSAPANPLHFQALSRNGRV